MHTFRIALTVAIGDSVEMQKAIAMLNEVKESIMYAYEIKTGQSRAKISHMMDAETWLNANKAVELGFADDILFKQDEQPPENILENSFIFSRRAVTNSLLNKLPKAKPVKPPVPADELEKRLSFIKQLI